MATHRPIVALRRHPPGKSARHRVLLVCEGERTEPHYFQALRDRLRLNTLFIQGTPGLDPRRLVEVATNEARREKRHGDSFDSVYCVFDRDAHPKFPRGVGGCAISQDQTRTFMALFRHHKCEKSAAGCREHRRDEPVHRGPRPCGAPLGDRERALSRRARGACISRGRAVSSMAGWAATRCRWKGGSARVGTVPPNIPPVRRPARCRRPPPVAQAAPSARRPPPAR